MATSNRLGRGESLRVCLCPIPRPPGATGLVSVWCSGLVLLRSRKGRKRRATLGFLYRQSTIRLLSGRFSCVCGIHFGGCFGPQWGCVLLSSRSDRQAGGRRHEALVEQSSGETSLAWEPSCDPSTQGKVPLQLDWAGRSQRGAWSGPCTARPTCLTSSIP